MQYCNVFYIADSCIYEEGWFPNWQKQRGCKHSISTWSPIKCISLLLTANFWLLLVTQTNLHAKQFLEQHLENLGRSSRFRKWKEVTVEEMKTFFGLYLLMGQVRKSKITDYWSTRNAGETPHFGKYMSRMRWKIIKSFLHFANNSIMMPRGHSGKSLLVNCCIRLLLSIE